MKKNNKKIFLLPSTRYYVSLFFITFLGIVLSFYLAVSHYRNYVDIGYQSFCAISPSLNCDTVSQSPYSIFFNIPVPIWGIIAHGFFLFLLSFAAPWKNNQQRIWTLLMLVSMGFSIYCVILACISIFLIKSYCIMCVLGYGVCFLQLYFLWLIRKRFVSETFFKALKNDFFYLLSFPKITIAVVSGFFVLALLLFLFLPRYWEMKPPELTLDLSRGVTADGHPWIGAENPDLTVNEFSDYLCFPCKKNYLHLRRIIQKYPTKIRLVHHHFPMDHTVNPIVKQPFHVGAGKLAMVAIAAQHTGKFWEMNDILFSLPSSVKTLKVKDLADKAGIGDGELKQAFNEGRLNYKLQQDIQKGLKLGLSGTPGFVINGTLYVGQIPANIFRDHGIFK